VKGIFEGVGEGGEAIYGSQVQMENVVLRRDKG
jgi:hypothetical protein